MMERLERTSAATGRERGPWLDGDVAFERTDEVPMGFNITAKG